MNAEIKFYWEDDTHRDKATGLVLDHAPAPGPLHYDFRCLVCSQPVDEHGSWLARWRWRRATHKNTHLSM